MAALLTLAALISGLVPPAAAPAQTSNSESMPLKQVTASWILMNSPEVLDAVLRAGPLSGAVKRAGALLPPHQAASAAALPTRAGSEPGAMEALGRASLQERLDFGEHIARPAPERRVFFGIAMNTGVLTVREQSQRGIRAVEAWTFHAEIGPGGALLRDLSAEPAGGGISIAVKAGQRYAVALEMDASSAGAKSGSFRIADGRSTTTLSTRGLTVNPNAQLSAYLQGGSCDLAAGESVRRTLVIRSAQPGASAGISLPKVEGLSISAPSRVRIGADGTAQAEVEFKADSASADLAPVRASLRVSIEGRSAEALVSVSIASVWMASEVLAREKVKASWWLNSGGLAVCRTEAAEGAGFGFALAGPTVPDGLRLGHWQSHPGGAQPPRRIEAGVDLRLAGLIGRLSAVEARVYDGQPGAYEAWKALSRSEPLSIKPVE